VNSALYTVALAISALFVLERVFPLRRRKAKATNRMDVNVGLGALALLTVLDLEAMFMDKRFPEGWGD